MTTRKLSRYMEIANELRQLIQNNATAAGDQLPTETQLMKTYGVSRHTIRQALDQLAHENMLVRIPGKGTFTSQTSSLHEPAENLVAVIMTYISDYIFPSIVRGIEQRLRESSYSMILLSTQNRVDLERRALQTALDQNCQGIILEPTKSTMPNQNLDIYDEICSRQLPVVLLHADPPGFPPFYKILFDDQEGAYLLTEHLIMQGHKSIGGVFKIDDKQGLFRLKGFIAALEHYHIPFDPTSIFLYSTESKGIAAQEYVRSMFAGKPQHASGIVCYNDEIAIAVIKQLEARGFHVPGQVSVVGFDDSPLAALSHPELTTIRHPKEEMGKTAASVLLNLISGTPPTPAQKMVFPAELIIRQSTKKLRIPEDITSAPL